MPKAFDAQLLNKIIIDVVQDTFKKMFRVECQGQPAVAEKGIIEYQGRMSVCPMEKFNGPAYVAFVNYYLSEKDLKANVVTGTFVLFVKEEIAEKLLKAFGLSSKDAEDEKAVMENIGSFCNIIAGNVANELAGLGYALLTISSPATAKNSIAQGVPFDYGLFTKQELTFTFWNQKCIVIEACLGHIAQEKK